MRWNREAFGNIINKKIDKGITLYYWYNKEKIKSFSIVSRDVHNETFYFTSVISVLAFVLALFSGFSSIAITLSGAAIIASWIFHSMNSVSFALSVSVVFKNGNALTTTAFYNDRLIFINSFTFYSYRYGSWTIPDIDDWRGHP